MENKGNQNCKKTSDLKKNSVKKGKNTMICKDTIRNLTPKENYRKKINQELAIIKENKRLSSNIIKTRSSLSVNKLNAEYKNQECT